MKKDGSERAGCLEAWLHNHADAAVRSFRRRLAAPGQTLIMIAVLGFILALPAYLWLLLENARALSSDIDHEPRIALYLDDITAEELAATVERVGALDGIARVDATGADQALDAYRASLPDPALLDWLDENPLPAIVEVVPLQHTPEAVQALESRLTDLLPRATLISDHEWVRQLDALHGAGLRILMVIAGLLALGITLILAVASAAELRERREEISISRITGATDRFLRRPSLYGGLMIGLGGGLVSYGLLWIGVGLTRLPVEEAAAVFGLPLVFVGPRLQLALLLATSGVLLGWLGARLGSGAALRD
ncbi:Cell division protein FtsX [Thioalkalivibrio nitratireducens DSM 14787]|uniref:Cell division protein FtsX n=1 Tax=Thioalkalivibrio nitratireducens (strain DSM 14787 / UNIQEM 213 / ALEN2) TaxID=1255043 RepID=L0DSF2_THIND|nr:permease-like cell division protein FtsX [Thioalkalivibrio nitratireducens]AGA31917.1 Cell division protein FtsX [Thioalkalivibrio nitratireducens DSM 14787]